jgi:hypothetical protein
MLVKHPFDIFSLTNPLALLTGIAWVLSLPLAGLYAQLYRYRRVSSPQQRKQTKWVVFGLALWVALLIVQTLPYSLLLSSDSGDPLPWWAPLSQAGWWLSLTIIPLSLAVSILRFRLWDIDVIIRRTLQYSLLTGLLALVYFGGVATLQGILGPLTGQSDSAVATVVITLATAALFNPLRQRIQEFIDRRFYRQKYDAEQALAQFAATAREEVNIERLSHALLGVVEETTRPERASLWLIPTNEEP